VVGETNKVGANTKTGTTAGRYTHAWDVSVKDAKGGGGSQSNQSNLIQTERSFRDGESSQSNHKSLYQVFDSALNKLTKVKSYNVHHFIDIIQKKNIYMRLKLKNVFLIIKYNGRNY